MCLKAAPKAELSLGDCAGRRGAAVVDYISPTSAVIAAPAPVVVCTAPTPAVTAACAPVVEFIAPAPPVIAAPSLRSSISHQLTQ